MQQDLVICACRQEGLVLARFDEEDDIKELYISLWKSGYYSQTWRERLHHIWHIIRTGYAYTDQIILDKEGATLLASVCEQYLHSGKE